MTQENGRGEPSTFRLRSAASLKCAAAASLVGILCGCTTAATEHPEAEWSPSNEKAVPMAAEQEQTHATAVATHEKGSASAGSALIGDTTWKVPPDFSEAGADQSAVRQWLKSLRAPVMVYWGAEWCPPCNELKSQVFTHADFAPLTDTVTRVFIDGDSASAQMISEVLGVSGYPTLVVLDQEGRETARIAESLNFDEFREVFVAASAGPALLSERIERTRTGAATADDWKVLANTRWEFGKIGIPGQPVDNAKLLVELEKSAPTQHAREKALLFAAAAASVAALEGQAPEVAALKSSFAKEYAQRFQSHTRDASSLLAIRSFLIYEFESQQPFLDEFAAAQREGVVQNWLRSAEKLSDARQFPQLSIDSRLWTIYPRILVEQKRASSAAQVASGKSAATTGRAARDAGYFPAELTNQVNEKVTAALEQLATPYERKSVVTGAAYLLQSIGEYDRAHSILEAELKRIDTPWYVYSALASLERKRGDDEKALFYSGKSRETAMGRATRFQWGTSDLLLSLKLKRSTPEVLPLLGAVYDTAFQLEDGFRGRNYSRINSIESALSEQAPRLAESDPKSRAELDALFLGYKQKCQKLDKESAMRCETHFLNVIEGLAKTNPEASK